MLQAVYFVSSYCVHGVCCIDLPPADQDLLHMAGSKTHLGLLEESAQL